MIRIWACRWLRATSFHPTWGLADLVRSAHLRKRLLRPAWRRGHDGGHESRRPGMATWPKSSRRVLVVRQHAADSAIKFRADINVIGVPLTDISNNAYTDPRQRQLFKNIIYVGVLSVLLDMDASVFEVVCRAVQGQGAAARFERQGTQSWPRLCQAAFAGIHSGFAFSALTTWATRFWSMATPPPRWVACTVAPPWQRGDHAIVFGREAFQKYCEKGGPGHRAANSPSLRAEDELASIGMVIGRGLEWRARVYRHLRPRHFLDAGIHRLGVLCRDSPAPSSTCSVVGLPPACPHAPSIRTCCCVPTPRTVIPTTMLPVPARPERVF